MNHIQDGEASSVADRSHEHVEPVLPVKKIAFWIERTLVTTHLFSFPLRVRNNRVSLYHILSTDHEHHQSQNMSREVYIFFSDKTYRMWHNIG